MRTVECLEPNGRGYGLHRQFKLDGLFPGLPGAEKELEADVEALEVAHGRLWVCGSHSLTRRSRDKTDATVDPKIRERPSRRLLGSVELTKDGGGLVAPGKALPYDGAGNRGCGRDDATRKPLPECRRSRATSPGLEANHA